VSTIEQPQGTCGESLIGGGGSWDKDPLEKMARKGVHREHGNLLPLVKKTQFREPREPQCGELIRATYSHGIIGLETKRGGLPDWRTVTKKEKHEISPVQRQLLGNTASVLTHFLLINSSTLKVVLQQN